MEYCKWMEDVKAGKQPSVEYPCEYISKHWEDYQRGVNMPKPYPCKYVEKIADNPPQP